MVSDPTICPSDLLNAQCPTRAVLDLVGDKWTVLVLHFLAQGTQRYRDLQREVGGISPKMLTQTLRRLEEDGFVVRTVYPEVPPRTEYRLTPLGMSLHEPLRALAAWAIDHLAEVHAARLAYAARRQEPAS